MLLLVWLMGCGSGGGNDSGASVPGGTADPACSAVWDIPFRTEDATTCYGTSGTIPGCYGCVLLRADRSIRRESDLVEIVEDPVTCSSGSFSQNGVTIATYDPANGLLSSSFTYSGRFVADDLGVCDGLHAL